VHRWKTYYTHLTLQTGPFYFTLEPSRHQQYCAPPQRANRPAPPPPPEQRTPRPKRVLGSTETRPARAGARTEGRRDGGRRFGRANGQDRAERNTGERERRRVQVAERARQEISGVSRREANGMPRTAWRVSNARARMGDGEACDSPQRQGANAWRGAGYNMAGRWEKARWLLRVFGVFWSRFTKLVWINI